MTTPPKRQTEGYEAFDEMVPGDLILLNGTPRKVRRVTRYEDDAVYTITLAIRRKSWTNRPYTTLYRTDIRDRFGGILRRRTDLRATPLEARVQDAIELERTPDGRLPRVEDLPVTAAEMAGAVL